MILILKEARTNTTTALNGLLSEFFMYSVQPPALVQGEVQL